ncbi:HCP-like protein [Acaromyces ingoldii]|uniref:HCP-like protein n=1 Tax=Acaromyces ingoldii TaxID=215250 RepID=A0A316YNT9_9BASI|nr:HCP-like protein [Acaromyces ingoldii]PWN91210.1 HCP-like protein [Acaromyces ingoldii]
MAAGASNSVLPGSASNMGGLGATGATRPASIAPTVSGALLDHSHLKPGQQAALLSHNKTLELYRQNAKKTNDPNLIYEFAVFMIDASKGMGGDDSSGGSGPAAGGGGGSGSGHQNKEETAKDELVREAIGLLKKIAERGHPDAQYFLADCYANGIGTPKGKQDFDRAYPLFVLAAKHGHPDAAYRAATCYEKGWGCRKDSSKALQFYRKASSQSHPGAQYRLATAELNGELGLKKSAREGVKWLKRSAEAATPEFPHALHELALLHERGIENVLFVDQEYACELLAQAGEMGYAPSAYKLGVNYEYGRMGCPQDGGLSIHMYNIAAQQNHKEACFALTAWYLVGAPGILPQSDTEAYLWAKKAAEQGLAKAEYAVGYFKEMGIGTVKDLNEARAWYRAAAEHGDKRANQRLAAIGSGQAPGSGPTNYQAQGAPTSYEAVPTDNQKAPESVQSHNSNQAFQNGYQTPQNNFQAPQNNFQAPQHNFQAPQNNFQAPQNHYQAPPNNNYQPHSSPYQSPNQYQGPPANYPRQQQPPPPLQQQQRQPSGSYQQFLPHGHFQQQAPLPYKAAPAPTNYQR